VFLSGGFFALACKEYHMNDNLDQLTDRELDELVAVEVAVDHPGPWIVELGCVLSQTCCRFVVPLARQDLGQVVVRMDCSV
jgi:hypothetical protein